MVYTKIFQRCEAYNVYVFVCYLGMVHTPHTPGMAHTPGANMALTPGSAPPSAAANQDYRSRGPSKHLIYATHFPIPQDEYGHEGNQRMMVLYGVGEARDEAKQMVRRITKEITKLFSKKNSLDVVSGDVAKLKKKKEKEKDKDTDSSASYESTFGKFQKLSLFDQHAVTASCVSVILESFSGFVSGGISYLPLISNLSYMFDLMEHCLNISGLMDLSIQVRHRPTLLSTSLKMHQSIFLHL